MRRITRAAANGTTTASMKIAIPGESPETRAAEITNECVRITMSPHSDRAMAIARLRFEKCSVNHVQVNRSPAEVAQTNPTPNKGRPSDPPFMLTWPPTWSKVRVSERPSTTSPTRWGRRIRGCIRRNHSPTHMMKTAGMASPIASGHGVSDCGATAITDKPMAPTARGSPWCTFHVALMMTVAANKHVTNQKGPYGPPMLVPPSNRSRTD